MTFDKTDIKELTNNEHQVLGADFCSGYTDIFGKWNTGFDCPRMRNGKTVYCCGTVTLKYCCTRRDQSNNGISQTVMISSALGSVLVIALVTLVSCLICRRCVPYRRAHSSLNGGPLYTMQCSSTTSGMANMYTFSGQSTAITSPMENSHVLVNLEAMEFAYSAQRGISRHLMRSGAERVLSEPPPPYNEPSREHNIVFSDQPIGFAMQTTCGHASSDHRRPPTANSVKTPNILYWSTKF